MNGKKLIVIGIISIPILAIFAFFVIILINFFSFFGYASKDENNKYETYTVLFNEENSEFEMYVSTNHLNESFHKSGYVSNLHFVINNKGKDIDIKIKKIKIEYSYKMKKIPIYKKESSIRCTSYENFYINENKAENQYEDKDLPIPINILSKDELSVVTISFDQIHRKFRKYRKMKENIYIEFEINDKLYKVKKEYDIFFKYKYSLFDAWMSV